MEITITTGTNEEISPDQLRLRVSDIQLESGLRFTTLASAGYYRYGKEWMMGLINPLNLSILAKAFLLWGNPNGRPLRQHEGFELLTLVNSVRWYSRANLQSNQDECLLACLVRQAHMQVATMDPLDANIARTYCMFRKLIATQDLIVDPAKELVSTFGVSADDLWTLSTAIFAFYLSNASKSSNEWKFRANFVPSSPKRDTIEKSMTCILSNIALSPDEFRTRYAAQSSKYRNNTADDSFWISEFNILRDFPVVRLSPEEFCAPFPIFAFTRGSVGFYFDLLEIYAQRERVDNPGNKNPYDNKMAHALGKIFQSYTGLHLRTLTLSNEELLPEFEYISTSGKADSPDWILVRRNSLPVFFECKARRPTLTLQVYATYESIKAEAKSVVSRALKQFTRFVLQIETSKDPKLQRFKNLPKCIFGLVLYEPFAFHVLPMVREMIDQLASELEPEWDRIKERVLFVPMSIRELETLVAAETTLGIPVEAILEEYAAYRAEAKIFDGPFEFSCSLEEHIQKKYNKSKRVVNPQCARLWNEFCGVAFDSIFGESLELYLRNSRTEQIQRLAYRRWTERGSPLGDDWRDWLPAEKIIDKKLEEEDLK